MFFQYVWLTVFYYDNEQLRCRVSRLKAMLNCVREAPARSLDLIFFFLIKVETTYNSLLLHLSSYKSKTLFKTIQNIYLFVYIHNKNKTLCFCEGNTQDAAFSRAHHKNQPKFCI